MAEEPTARRFFFFLFIVTAVLLAAVIYPIASALFVAAVFAGVLWPLHKRLARVLHGARGIAAGILVLGVVLVVVAPLAALSTVAVKEVTNGLRYVTETMRSEGVTGLVGKLPPSVQKIATKALERLPSEPGDNLESTVERQVSVQGGRAAAVVTRLVAATGSLVFQVVLMLIALYFLLVEGGISSNGWIASRRCDGARAASSSPSSRRSPMP